MSIALDTKIVLITGERQVGKSTALSRALAQLPENGLQISGLLTRRTGPHDLVVTELRSGATYALTSPFAPSPASATPNFTMDPVAFQRSSAALAASFPTDLFILDEIGPLELVRGQGWIRAVDLLRTETYKLALVVVRPELLEAATRVLPGTGFGLLRVTATNRDVVPHLLVQLVCGAGSDQKGSRA